MQESVSLVGTRISFLRSKCGESLKQNAYLQLALKIIVLGADLTTPTGLSELVVQRQLILET
jgi:hypothetical protein